MVPTAPSQKNRTAEMRWQDRVIACFWLPFSLVFHLWVYFTPAYEEKWELVKSPRSGTQPRSPVQSSFAVVALVVVSVLGFTLFALMTMPPLTARMLLVLAFGFSFWKFMQPKT